MALQNELEIVIDITIDFIAPGPYDEDLIFLFILEVGQRGDLGIDRARSPKVQETNRTRIVDFH